MEGLLIKRAILILCLILLIVFLLRISKSLKRERRIARYSLNMNSTKDLSLFDKLSLLYSRITNKYQNNKILAGRSKKYHKYLNDSDFTNASIFIINKLITAFIFVVLVIISYTIKGKNIGIIGFIISFIIGYYLYDIYLLFRTNRKKKKIKNDMLRAVVIMNNAFKAGKSTLQAVEIASKELPNPIAEEFKKIHQDMSYGLSADIAFRRFARKINIEEAYYISSSLTILSKTGGNIINVFNSIEKTLFDKKKLESDLKNSTAASNLVIKILMIIPVLFVLAIYVISPNYFSPLFNNPIGIFMLLIIIIMFITYTYLLSKIMKVRI